MRGQVQLQHEEKRWNFNMRWQCTPNNSALDLYTVYGDKMMEFTVTPQQAKAKDRTGRIYLARNGEELARQSLGMQVPINSLCQWLMGIPSTNGVKSLLTLDAQSRLSMLKQSGWNIEYRDYQDYLYNDRITSLPERLILAKKGIQITVSVAHRKLI